MSETSERLDYSNSSFNPLKQLKTWQRLHFRLTLFYSGAVLASLVIMGVILYHLGVKAELQGTQKRLLATVISLSSLADAQFINTKPENSQYRASLFQHFKQVASGDSDIETIYVLMTTGQPTQLKFFVDYAKDGIMAKPGELYDASELPVMLRSFKQASVEDKLYADEYGLTLSGYAPIKDKRGNTVAIVGADVNASRIAELRSGVLFTTFSVFSIAFVIIGGISYVVAQRVREPLSHIIKATDAITHGKLNTRIDLHRNDELGLMGKYFDKMAEGLEDREQIREIFGRYVSHDVAKTMLDHREKIVLGGEERVVTILFSDIEGYSTVAEQLPPVKVVEMINGYLGEMNQIIDNYHGCVIEYFGDAILAVFGAPNYVADHCEQAVRCAQQMRDHLIELNQHWQTSGLARYWKDKGIEQLRARIGVHTGSVVSGNLGSKSRMKYAVIGDAVNIASRLENLNKQLGTEILVSSEVRAQLPEELAAKLLANGEHRVKGREQAIRVYSLA